MIKLKNKSSLFIDHANYLKLFIFLFTYLTKIFFSALKNNIEFVIKKNTSKLYLIYSTLIINSTNKFVRHKKN